MAVMLGVHPKTVIRLFRRQELAAFRPGGKLWRTSREEVDAYVARNLYASRSASLCRDLRRDFMAVAVTDRAKE